MWDKEKAVQALNNNAQPTSRGRCAEYTRKAIEAGGVTLIRHKSAGDYGLSLKAAGFSQMQEMPKTFKAGDVAIISAFKGHADGHMEMFNGKEWVSDFKQHGIYPGPSYRKQKPHITIFRHA